MRSGRRQRQANTSTLTCWSPSRSLLIIVPHQSSACCLCWDRADVAPMISNWTCWKKAVIATILLLAISSYQQISCIQFDETDDMITGRGLVKLGVESCCLQGGCHFVYEYLHATCSNLTFSQSFWNDVQWSACLNLRALLVISPSKARPLIECRVFWCFFGPSA